MAKDHFLFRIALLATILAFCVVVLGATTRLKEAGLGCPDWPGCYGHLVVPEGNAAQVAAHAFGGTVEAPKAWAEMIHRYVAGSLALLILIIFIRSWTTRKQFHSPVGLTTLITLLVILQASLGRWTVTLKLLPPIVMFHLLGGMALVTLLSLLTLRVGNFFNAIDPADTRRFRAWAIIGLFLLILQIMLGGWTSANYASLACTDFPYCNGALIPPLDFSHAFTSMDKIVDQSSKITIHMCHRFGAAMVFTYWLILCLMMLGTTRSKTILRLSVIILILLIMQVSLGILNVMLHLPLHVAVSHNAVATLLLVSVVALNSALYVKH